MAESERLQKLGRQKQALEHKIRLEHARMKEQERKQDTRRKIIAGGLVLKDMQVRPDGDLARAVLRLLDEYVEREQDRALFGLPPKPEADTAANDDDNRLTGVFRKEG